MQQASKTGRYSTQHLGRWSGATRIGRFNQIAGGEQNNDFTAIFGSFDTGEREQLTVAVQLDGSGTLYAINSFDDLFAIGERGADHPALVPETPGTGLLIGFAFVGTLRLSSFRHVSAS